MTEKQNKAHEYCINNNIRVSPIAAESGLKVTTWYVGISTPENYKKVYKSPEVYASPEIWDAVSKAEIFYYEKSI